MFVLVVSGNEFHIPGQNYGGQGGNQVGGGGSNVGVPGGRGPAGLSGIQPLGQTTTGLGGGGPGGAGQQAPPQPPTQSLQQQGPNQTSTPPGVHTSTAPDMGKQPHLQQAQPNTLPPNSYGQAPTRPVAVNILVLSSSFRLFIFVFQYFLFASCCLLC